MSIGIYAFLRIYFLCFCLSAFAQFRTRCQFSSARRCPDLPGVACLVSSADRCSVSSVWACVLVRGVVCLASGTVCPVACDVQSVRLRWMWQGCTGGVYSRRPAPPGQSFNHRKNKKGSKNHPHPISNLKISRKNKKTPTKGLCSVLYLPYKP